MKHAGKIHFLCAGVSFAIFSCMGGVQVKTRGEVIDLKNFEPIPGYHCESTSIMNALNFQGVKMSEAMINGLAATPGFHFMKNDGFPFLGARILNLKENFSEVSGLSIRVIEPPSPQAAWDSAKSVLRRGIPLVMRVDMRYLPYLWGGKYGDKYSTFGWHYICLHKIDERSGMAWVTETIKDSQPTHHGIRIEHLMKASSSREGFLKAENYMYYFEVPDGYALDRRTAFKASLKNLLGSFTGQDGALKHLEQFPEELRYIESSVNTPYVLKPLFFTFYGYIEKFGTGGAAFRNFLRDYLDEVGEGEGFPVEAASAAVEASCRQWRSLAAECDAISRIIGDFCRDEEKRKPLYVKAAGLAEQVYSAEKDMVAVLENLYNTI